MCISHCTIVHVFILLSVLFWYCELSPGPHTCVISGVFWYVGILVFVYVCKYTRDSGVLFLFILECKLVMLLEGVVLMFVFGLMYLKPVGYW